MSHSLLYPSFRPPPLVLSHLFLSPHPSIPSYSALSSFTAWFFSKRSVDTTVHLSSQPSGIRFTRSFLNFLFIYINSCNYGRTSSLEVIGNGPIQTIYPLPCISGHFHPSFTFLISRRRVSYHWVIYNKVSGVRRYRKETLKTRLARWGIA